MSIDKIILGTVQLGLSYGINSSGKMLSSEEALAVLQEAKTAGINTLDTAEVYGNAINIIGLYHQEGKAFEIISKFHIKEDSDFTEEFKKDLKRLNVSKAYALLFHSFQDYSNNTDQIKKLLKLKEENLLGKIGLSIYTNEEFEIGIEDKNIDLIQLPFNVLDNDNLRGELLEKAKRNNKEIHVRSIFLQGLFYKEIHKVPHKLEPLKPYLGKLQKIAEEFNISVSQLAFMYVLQHKNVDKVIFGVDNLPQLKSNIELIKNLPQFDVVDRINKEIFVKEKELLNPYNWKTKVLLITQARMGSTRLPGKVMKTVDGQSLLEIHVKRLKLCKKVDEILVATTLAEQDKIISDLADEQNFKSFRGSENDVLDRYYQSALPYKPEYIVRVTSDCPLLDSLIVDEAIGIAMAKGVDYCSNTLNPTFPNGQDVEVFKFSALEKAWKEAKLDSEREHVTPYIWKNCNLKGGKIFTAFSYENEVNYGNLRMTVDEEADFKVIEQLIKRCGSDKQWMEYTNMLLNGGFSDLNKQYGRNEGYQKSLKKDGKK
jgi:spore coat polysaccharide biosynthesis protein SpsF